MTSIDAIAEEFPLHWCVWNDNHIELQDLLKDEKVNYIYYEFVIEAITDESANVPCMDVVALISIDLLFMRNSMRKKKRKRVMYQ